MILGIDEVGRGVWAGPLVVGAVVLGDAHIDGLTDSKKLSDKKRRQLDILIREQASGYGLGWVSPSEIDEIGLSAALCLATRRAVEQVKVPYSEIIIDGTINFLADTGKGKYVTTMKKADLLISAVSAASIVAKVARDSYMIEQAKFYPHHFFHEHVGYGTEKHRSAIDNFGLTPLHRRSVRPIREVVTGAKWSPKAVGDQAEDLVAEYLKNNGHEVTARNWKIKSAEIDIVSRIGNRLYFTEVKFRRSADQGGGLMAITPVKLKQMQKAAELFVQFHNLASLDRSLAVASVSPDGIETWMELE